MRKPSHSTVVAYLALFAALGGTAFAAAKIGSSGIARDAIKSKHIATGAVTGSDVDEATLETYGPKAYVRTGTLTFADTGLAYCDGSDFAVGAGYDSRHPALSSKPISTGAGTPFGWQVTAEPGANPFVQVTVVCLPFINPPTS